MYCTNCGNKLKDTEHYCTNCGKKITISNLNNNQTKNNYDILSIIFGFIGIALFWNIIISIPLAIIGIVLGKKHKKETGDKVPGIIISVISLILSSLVIIFIMVAIIFSSHFLNIFINSIENYTPYQSEEYDKYFENYDIQGYSWLGDDNSVLYLEKNKNYIWYQNDNEHTDNYHSGTYQYYNGTDAINYITTNLPQYGITKEEQYELFEDSTYNVSDYYLIIINCNKAVMNGIEQYEVTNAIYYYGFYDKTTNRLELVNMNSNNKAGFIRKDKLKNIDI